MEPGHYSVRVTLAGYKPATRDISVKEESTQTVTIPLERETGRLRIRTVPDSVSVFLRNQKLGTTPLIRTLDVGTYRIRLKKSGYHEVSKHVRIVANQEFPISERLSALTGTLKVKVKPYGSIYVDGDLKGTNSDQIFESTVSIGKHRIRVIHPVYGIFEKTVPVQDNQEQFVSVDFTSKVKITITSKPWGFAFLDGKQLPDETPIEIEVRIGQHTIEVRRPGFNTVDGPRLINVEEPRREHFILVRD